MNEREALKLALEALQWNWGGEPLPTLELQAINAIKEVLAQPEQEPVANGIIRTLISIDKDGIETWKHEPFYITPPQRQSDQEPVAMRYDFDGYGWSYIDNGSGSNWREKIKNAEPLYTAPPQRTWVGLTEEERDHFEGLHLYAARGKVDVWIEGVPAFIQAIEAKLREKNGC